MLDRVYFISNKLDTATEEQVRMAEAALGTRFPSGYSEYVTRLGAGELNGSLHVLMPTEIGERTRDYQAIEADSVAEAERNGFSGWDLVQTGLDLLPPQQWLSAVPLVDTGDGHRIVFHPDAPDELFFIPHEDTGVYRAGSTLVDALTWFLETEPWAQRTRVLLPNGQSVERSIRYFEPILDREHIMFRLNTNTPFTELRAHFLHLIQQQPDNTLFVSEIYGNDDATEGEVLHLFIKEYSGAVWCNDTPGNIIAKISYDRDHYTADLDELITFFSRQGVRLGL